MKYFIVGSKYGDGFSTFQTQEAALKHLGTLNLKLNYIEELDILTGRDYYFQLTLLSEQKSKIEKKMVDLALPAILERLQNLFSEYPWLESIGFQAYTPYFNDGDSCTYGVYADEPIINGVRDEWDSDMCSKEDYVNVCNKFSKLIYDVGDDIIGKIFGDHTSVEFVVDKETGFVNVEQSEYSHD